MNLLILGGTAEAKVIVRQLTDDSINIVYSIAGLVRQPELECRIVSGGFRQFGGLQTFIQQEQIDAILDATHPYAATMSDQAVETAENCNIPCWRFLRAPWQSGEEDNWVGFDHMESLFEHLSNRKSVFFAVGQLDQSFVDRLKKIHQQNQVMRTAVKPTIDLPDSINWIQAIGPFDHQSELALFQQYQFDALVCKNSGGEASYAKLVVARQLSIPVFLLKRPQLKPANREFAAIKPCVEFVRQQAA